MLNPATAQALGFRCAIVPAYPPSQACTAAYKSASSEFESKLSLRKELLVLLNSGPSVPVCDARGDAKGTAAGIKKNNNISIGINEQVYKKHYPLFTAASLPCFFSHSGNGCNRVCEL